MFSSSKTAAPVSGSYAVKQSLRFRSSASAYLNRTPSVAGNQQKFTFSTWLKRGALGNYIDFFGAGNTILAYYSDNTLYMNLRAGATNYVVGFANVFRDPSAWYHIVWAVDTTQATASNRALLYVNGVQLTAASGLGQSWCPQNTNLPINSTIAHYIGTSGGSNYLDGYLAEVNFIDGQALTPSSFGTTNATTGVWQPARYTGSYGTNGFYLTFGNKTSTTTLGNDTSGNGNNWTTNNISLTAGSTYDSMLDSPTNYDDGGNGVGNYAVLNPLVVQGLAPYNANLTLGGTTSYSGKLASIGISSGKWYWEQTIDSLSSNNLNTCQVYGGVATAASSLNGFYGIAGHWGFTNTNTSASTSGSVNNGISTDGYTIMLAGVVVGLALDMDSGSLSVYRNNVLLYSVGTSLAGNIVYPVAVTFAAAGNSITSLNFGQRPFAYTAPSGFKALNTQNLPATAIVKGSAQMNVVLDNGYAGVLTANGSIAAGSYANWLCISTDGTSVYVANNSASTLSLYQRNTSTGSLTANGTISSGAAGICISADGSSVYATGSGNVYLFQRSTSTGALTSNSTIAAGTTATGICISADGTSVYVANYGSATISLYQRNTSTGALTSNGTIAAGTNPAGICISADGTSVYATNYGSNTISLYQRNTSTGALTSNSTIACSNGPHGICISADGTSVYAATYNATYQIASYQRNTSTGSLTANGTLSTTSGPQSVAISSDGLSVYVPGNNASATTVYTRAPTTGLLTSAGTIASGNGSTGVCIASNGTSVYVANHSDNTVSLYQRATTDIKTTSQALYTYYLEWIKDRANVNNHQLADTVRGNTAILQSNTMAVETTYTAPSGNSVGWVWNANTAAVTNNTGSITSQVSANTTAGFSVCTFAAAASSTFGHGLGVAPSMVIFRGRTDPTNGWLVYHASLGPTQFIQLSSTGVAGTNATVWNNTAPTSSVVTIGSGATFANYGNCVAYCFAAIAGYSAFGSYTGNGSTDGPFVWTGFLPRFVLFKNTTDGTVNWFIFDSARNTYNSVNGGLCPSNNGSENVSTALNMDLLSNGFKLRNTNNSQNVSGNVYIYAAFASSPFKNSLAF